MKNFKSINRDGTEFEFCWFCVNGEFLQAGYDNIIVDEFIIRPFDKSIKGNYIMQVLDMGVEAKILSQTRDDGAGVKGKGICEAMLPELCEYYGKTIISSSNLHSVIPEENRVKGMTAIYREIEIKGTVSYDLDRDVFIFPKR